ncbi:MAG: HsdR family type I site-specific deoxyribonuclease [Anaerolineae bacterium]|nr:HsdR family type I site-specific deoxyribonuclease [Anaerolineae bacterium]
MTTPSYLEDHISQIPALRLLMAMGWQYLPPAEVNGLRGGKTSNVILEGVLLDWLRANNRIQHKGQVADFSEANLSQVLRTLKDTPLHQGLIPASEEIYELLTLGMSVGQGVAGDQRHFDVKLIDWANPANNVYQVTDEFEVERRGSYRTRRPDIVLFVNGIPLVVIECKRPDKQNSAGEKSVYEAVSQMLRNQALADEIPHLFVYTQLLMAVSTNDALYATTGTAKDFWAVWQEEEEIEQAVGQLANVRLSDAEKSRLYDWREYGRHLRQYFDEQDAAGERLPTVQDRAIYSLLRPERLLELAYQYLVYDKGEKKVARYQQYFAIRATLDRVRHFEGQQRAGGVIWHTTGSGKSLMMVMLAKALTLHPAVQNPRVVIVTDRIDLDTQIWKTFRACGKTVHKAHSGADLVRLIHAPRHEIITTVIDKFEAAAKQKFRDDNPNIFVLVDESHRSQYGSSHARMREVFPNACYIGFTGTPLLKKEKRTVDKFGGFIHKYTMRQAVLDKAVVPLLYEGRMVELEVSKDALDQWFERRTANLNEAQKTDLKRKMSRYEEVNRVRSRIEAIAWDIAEHYKKNWRETGFKGQLATASKEQALEYLQALTNEGIRCDVIMSAPDTREGSEDISGESPQVVQQFWKRMMERYNTEETYLREIIADFGREEGVEILIVVDKLLVGFDEPRNTVLYVDKSLREHGLLQAIARVNRLCAGKDYGYIVDYRGVLGELNEALQTYNALEEFDAEDVEETITDMGEIVAKLPHLHNRLLAVFDPVPNRHDHEALERFLEPEDRRQQFYEALQDYARALKVALSMVEFYQGTSEAQIETYKHDLKFYHALRNAVQLRYAETIEYSEYEAKIRKLLSDHIRADGVTAITPTVNIFDEDEFAKVVEQMTGVGRADTIAHHLKKVASERMEEDPAFYRKFSQMVEEVIQQYKEGRLTELEYLNLMQDALDQMRAGRASDLPEVLIHRRDAGAYYGLLVEALAEFGDPESAEFQDFVADLAVQCEDMLNTKKVRDWPHNADVLNRMKDALDDLLYTVKTDYNLSLSGGDMDRIIDSLLDTAKKREQLTA